VNILLAILGAVVGFVVLTMAHSRFWRWYFRAQTRPSATIEFQAEDGVKLVMGQHHAAEPRKFLEPVVLCHGLAANRFNLDFDDYSLARYLAARGFEAYVLEVRGIGLSRGSRADKSRWTFDDFALRDGPAAIKEALRHAGGARAFWVGHSMGGMIAYVMGQTAVASSLAGVVALGSPATWSRQQYLRPLARFGRALANLRWLDRSFIYPSLAPFAGRWHPKAARLMTEPGNIAGPVTRRLVANTFEAVHPAVMRQFAMWIEEDRFCSVDRSVDYRAGLQRFTPPVLLIAGDVDRMAPPGALADVHAAVQSTDKTLMVFGRAQGHATAYGHGDLVFARAAPSEVFPRIAEWIEQRATPWKADKAANG
jgi:predicted alpha/beta hydrolase